MRAIAQFCDVVDLINDAIGRWAAWLLIPVILLLFLQIPLREVVGKGNLLANDMGQLLHATVFIVGAAYTLRWDSHVRVDMLYGRMSPRRRAWVNLVGAVVFMMPWLGWVGWWSAPIAWRSWRALELFPETWNPGYFHFRTLLLTLSLLLGIQALAMAGRALLVLRGAESTR